MKRLLIPLLLLTLACGAPTQITTNPATKGGTLLTSRPAETPQIDRNCYRVVVDTLYLRKGPAESFPAWDGLEKRLGYTFTAEPVWNERGELWLKLSPVEYLAGMIGEKVFVEQCH